MMHVKKKTGGALSVNYHPVFFRGIIIVRLFYFVILVRLAGLLGFSGVSLVSSSDDHYS